MAASNKDVKLIGILGSPVVTRVEVALKLKEIEYEYLHEKSLTEKSDLLLKHNPVHKKVPVLLHNEKPIAESLVIVEYIDETWKSGYPILPSHPYQRSLARFWSKFIDEKVSLAIVKAALDPNEKEREKGIEEGSEALQILENELKDKFFYGDSIGFVDIAGLFIAYWVPIIQEAAEFDLFNGEKFPKLHKWRQEIINHPIVKPLLPPKDRIFTFFKARSQDAKASK